MEKDGFTAPTDIIDGTAGRNDSSGNPKTSNSPSLDYEIPEWFLEHHVKSPTELRKLRPKIAVSDCINPTTISCKSAKAEVLQHDNVPSYVMSCDEFCDLRRMVAATFVRDSRDKLCLDEPSVLVCWSSKIAPSVSDGVIEHLAQELEATLITVGLEDLEDLAWEFDQQEQNRGLPAAVPDEKSRLSMTPLTGDYFGGLDRYYCRRPSDDFVSRQHRAVTAMLGIAKYETNSTPLRLPDDQHPLDNTRVPSKLTRTILYVQESSRVLALRKRDYPAEILTYLHFCVVQQRKSGKNITLLTTVVERNKIPENGCSCRMCSTDEPGLGQSVDESDYDEDVVRARTNMRATSRLKAESAGNGSPVVTLNPPTSKDEDHKDRNFHAMKINVRRLKRFLRDRLPLVMDLGPHSNWLHEVFDDLIDPEGTDIWEPDTVFQASRQIIGECLGKSHLSSDDVRVILRRVGLDKSYDKPNGNGRSDYHGEKVEDEITPNENGTAIEDTSAEKTSDESGDKIRITKPGKSYDKPMTIGERLKKIKPDLNEEEKELIGCVVNSEALDTSYEDVILDQHTKDVVEYLVSTSNFSPNVTSSLRNRFRIRGALMYGPPGTGKTHLSRAIARDSGANMLAINAASIKSKWIGEVEKNIQAAFTLSAKLFPCVLFIDEVDSLFYRRSSDDRSHDRSALAEFLTRMDGLVQSPVAPFVLVATNRPWDLDEAFLRRLPQKIYFQLPNRQARLAIIQNLLKGEEDNVVVNVDSLVERTDGYSGSDLRSLFAAAVMSWSLDEMRGGKDINASATVVKLCDSHFDKALEKIRPSTWEHGEDSEALAEFIHRFNPESVQVMDRTLPASHTNMDADRPRAGESYETSDDESDDEFEDVPEDVVQDMSPAYPPYRPLTGTEFRVLRVEPPGESQTNSQDDGTSGRADDMVTCHLYQVPLESFREFTALSYVWGHAKEKKTILLNGIHFDVTVNLHNALHNISLESVGKGSSRRLYWIDAICIDQDNNKEKELQIPRMIHIYGQARQVLIWLDPSHIRASDARYALEESEMKYFNQTKTSVVRDMTEAMKTARDPVPAIRAYVEAQGIRDDTVLIKVLFNIVTNPWFSRIWTVQEALLARRLPIISTGSGAIRFQDLITMWDVLTYNPTQANATEMQRVVELSPNLRNLLQLRRQLGREKSHSMQSIARFLLQLLYRTTENQSTVVHDRVYGLLGVLGRVAGSAMTIPELLPNYSLKFQQVFHSYTMFIIQHTGFLAILAHGGGWLPGVPTWVPDFRNLYAASDEAIFTTDPSKPPTFSTDGKVLYAEGDLFDTCGTRMPMATMGDSRFSNSRKNENLDWAGKIPSSMRRPFLTNKWRTYGPATFALPEKEGFALNCSDYVGDTTDSPSVQRQLLSGSVTKGAVDLYEMQSPQLAERGDHMCLFEGVREPFLLRKTKLPNRYQVVGVLSTSWVPHGKRQGMPALPSGTGVFTPIELV